MRFGRLPRIIFCYHDLFLLDLSEQWNVRYVLCWPLNIIIWQWQDISMAFVDETKIKVLWSLIRICKNGKLNTINIQLLSIRLMCLDFWFCLLIFYFPFWIFIGVQYFCVFTFCKYCVYVFFKYFVYVFFKLNS